MSSEVVGIDTYSWATSEPVTGPVLVSVSVAVSVRSAFAMIGEERERVGEGERRVGETVAENESINQ